MVQVQALKGITYVFKLGNLWNTWCEWCRKSTMINLITDNIKRDKNSGSILYIDDDFEGEDCSDNKAVDIL